MRFTILLFAIGMLLESQPTIRTFAGREWLYPTEKRAALDAPIGLAKGLAFDGKGNLYIADSGNHLVLRMTPEGVVEAIAGNGIPGYSGDGGPATQASLWEPHSVSVDQTGNIFIAEHLGQRLRRVGLDGRISTVASAPTIGPLRQIAHDSAGNLYAAEIYGPRILRFNPSGGMTTVIGTVGRYGFSPDGTPAAQALLELPVSVTVDANGIVYFAEFNRGQIRRINADGRLETIAGTGTLSWAGFGRPARSVGLPGGIHDISFGPDGLLYFTFGSGVARISSSGILELVAGDKPLFNSGDGGNALDASFNDAWGIAFQRPGTVLVSASDRIRAIDSSQKINTVVGNGKFRSAADASRASDAYFFEPAGLKFAPDGSLVIADTQHSLVRRILPNGSVSAAAGNGNLQQLRMTGLALLDGMGLPAALHVDSDGTILLTDRFSHRVIRLKTDGSYEVLAGRENDWRVWHSKGVTRDPSGAVVFATPERGIISRIGPDGTITRIAGVEIPQLEGRSGGDGGPALQAAIHYPAGLLYDREGRLYIAEERAGKIRRVRTDGIIETIAGGGTINQDNVPATLTRLFSPVDIALDQAGNLFIAEQDNHSVRYVTPQGVIRTLAGRGTSGYSGDGGLAAAAQLSRPMGVTTDSAGNVYISDSGNGVIRVVSSLSGPQNSENQFQVSARAVSLPVNAAARINLTSTTAGLPYTVTVPAEATWLRVTPASGVAPAALTIEPAATLPPPGSYNTVLRIASSLPGVVPINVTVTMTIPASAVSRLAISASQLDFSVVQSGGASQPLQRNLELRVTGTTPLDYATSVEGIGGITVSPASGRVTPSASTLLTVTLSAANRAIGVYSGTLRIRAGGEDTAIPIRVTVGTTAPSLLISQTGLTFTAVSGGGSPLPQSVGVLNIGGGAMDWNIRVSSVSGTGWLRVSTDTGRVERPYLDVSFFDVLVDPSRLPPGEHYGRIEVRSDAPNSPQVITVLAVVLAPGSSVGPELRPTGLIFTGVQNSQPGSQSVTVGNSTTSTIRFASSRLTFDGANWFQHLPIAGTIDGGRSTSVVVQPDFKDLAPGVRRGAVTMQFEDGAIRTVNLLTVVAPTGILATKDGRREAASCASDQLQVLFSEPTAGVAGAVGKPVNFEVRASDQCGNPLTVSPGNWTAGVTITFSNGEPPIALTHIGNGTWRGTWRPLAASPQVVARATALFNLGTRFQIGTASLNVSSQASPTTPLVVSRGVVHSASQEAGVPLVPGGLFTLYGAQLAAGSGTAGALPLPKTLNDVEIVLGDRPLSLLYTSPEQINVQVPYDIAPNTSHSLVVRRGTALSTPESVTVAARIPGVFTTNQSGSGQGHIYVARQDGALVLADSANPARPGDVLVIYCAGLGSVDQPVNAGDPAPSGVPAVAREPVSVTIGGQQAEVLFAGLSPQSTGLYQINARVPALATPGANVPLIVLSGGQASRPVQMSVTGR